MEDEFSLRVGRMRDRSGPVILHAAVTAGKLARRGRGQAAVRRLRVSTQGHGPGLRRVVVKARIVRLKGSRGAVRAHLAYLERDSVGPEGERGRLYDAVSDRAAGKAFLARGEGDRHQFRFIVSPEDGAELDLKVFTRKLMERMEQDLDTVLDWVAVDHTDTATQSSTVSRSCSIRSMSFRVKTLRSSSAPSSGETMNRNWWRSPSPRARNALPAARSETAS